MITCFIIDDEEHAINLLSRHIHKTPGLALIGKEIDPVDALKKISNNPPAPDIVFLDIDMPGLSGMEVADLIKDRARIIFTTGFDQYAVEAFEKNAMDYLLKPISYERFLKAIDRVRNKIIPQSLNEKGDHFFIKTETKGKFFKVNYADILYIEALHNYVQIHTPTEKYTTYLTMKEIEENLPAEKFVRVHKSFILQKNHIKIVDGNQVIMDNQATISIGVSYREAFLRQVNLNLLQTKRGN